MAVKPDVVFTRRCHADDRWTVYVNGSFVGHVKRLNPDRCDYTLYAGKSEISGFASLQSIRRHLGG